MKFLRNLLAFALFCVPVLVLTGCSTDDNPVSPEKMQTIRNKQADEMRQLSQSGKTPEAPPSK